MARQGEKRLWRRRPVLAAAVLLLLAGALAGLMLRIWITTDNGLAFLKDRIDGRAVAGLGEIQLAGIDGDPLSAFTLSGLVFSNEAGHWLEADHIRISWSPLALLSGRLQIEEIDADEIRLLRRPAPGPVSTGGAGPRLRMVLGSLNISRLLLAEGVAGPKAAMSVSAHLTEDETGRLEAALNLSPLAGEGDRIQLDLIRDTQSQLTFALRAEAPAGGVFAHLLALEPGSAARLEASAAGDLAKASGQARFLIDEAVRARIDGALRDHVLEATAGLDGPALPLPEILAAFIGPAGEARLQARAPGNSRAGKAWDFTLAARLQEGELTLSGQADPVRRRLTAPARLSLDLASLAPLEVPPAGLRLDGLLSLDPDRADWQGTVHLLPVAGSDLPFDAAVGTLSAGWAEARARIQAELEFAGLNLPLPGQDRPQTGQMMLAGEYHPQTDILTLAPSRLSYPDGTVNLSGTIEPGAARLDLSGELSLALDGLLPDLSGLSRGLFTLTGSFQDLELFSQLSLSRLEGPSALAALLDGNGRAEARLLIGAERIEAQSLSLRLTGLDASARGTLSGPQGTDLRVRLTQKAALDIAGMTLGAGEASAHFTAQEGRLTLSANSLTGSLRAGPVELNDVRLSSDLTGSGYGFEAPIQVEALAGDETIKLTGQAYGRSGTIGMEDLSGLLGPLRLTAEAEMASDKTAEARFSLAGSDLAVSGIKAGRLEIAAKAGTGAPGTAWIEATADLLEAGMPGLSGIDRVSLKLGGDMDELTYSARIDDASADYPTGLELAGQARLDDGAATGSLTLAGQLLGTAMTSRIPTTWQIGPQPYLETDLDLLGGRIQAAVRPSQGLPDVSFSVTDLDAEPGLAVLGLPALAVRINGQGRLVPFGASPDGEFTFLATSEEPALQLAVSGQILPDTALLKAALAAGQPASLDGSLDLRVPIRSGAEEMIRLDPDAGLSGTGQLEGDLASLRTLALAFGHDISGRIESRIEIGGQVKKPSVSGETRLHDASYEYGALGLRLQALNASALHDDGRLTIEAEARDRQGGSVRASGRLTGGTDSEIRLSLSRLTIFDRSRDRIRVSGNATFTETDTDRLLSGDLQIDEARFSMENLPGAGVHRLPVRWREQDVSGSAEAPLLEKPILLDMSVNAPRRLFVTGRGLDSEWGLAMRVSGSPARPALRGRASLVRGSVELARRPFVFETGTISLNGDVSSAQLDLRGEREADGLKTRVELVGPVSAPDIRLSSTPPMPEDEVLAHVLFGRSALDLTAMEAAELAASIARLSGQAGGVDPLGRIQSGLGLDRLRFGPGATGEAQLGLGRYLTPDVYLEVTAAGEAGNSALIDWQPRPGISVKSETSATGQSKISLQWKKDY